MNYRLAAVKIGDLLKYNSTINEINRAATAIFKFQSEIFPHESITSARAKCIYDWIMTLAKQRMENDIRNCQLIEFCRAITPRDQWDMIDQALDDSGIKITIGNSELSNIFSTRSLHPNVHLHSKELFLNGNFFHAVFESCKAYNKLVKEKSKSIKDGSGLMLAVWDGKSGSLKITACKTDTDINTQDGIKFLSAGLMQAIRNPTAHEPALDWPIRMEDCLDLLSFLSFLFRRLDEAVYYP